MWHERLGHAGKASTIAMAQKAGIDLSKPPPTDPCIPCGKAAGKTEPHKSHIQPGRWVGDLIHGDLMGPFLVGCNKARWTVCWLNNKTQISHVNTFYSKEALDVLSSFKTFLGIIQHDLNRCTRIRIDNSLEFMRNAFATFRNEQSIRTEPTTAGNPQMNGCAERLNQTLMRKTSTFHKDSRLPLKWWSELIHIANHIRNALISTSVINSKGQPISPFEAFTDYPYLIENFRRIGQAGEYLVTKSNIGWKKFQDRRKFNIFVGYESIKIYRIITAKRAIYRFFNVEWRGNKRPRDSNTTYLNDSVVIESNESPTITGLTIRSKIAAKNSAFTRVNNKINKILNEIAVELDEEVRHIVTSRQASSKSAPQNIAAGSSQQRTSAHSITSTPSINKFSNNVNKLNINTSFLGNTAGVNIPISDIASSHTIEHIQQKVLKQDSHLRSRRDSSVNLLALFVKCSSSDSYEPKNYNEAMTDINHKRDWKLVMNDEMQSFKDNKIWELVNSVSKDRKVLTDKWVYRVKRKINGKVIKYKTRWCVRDFEQVKDLDYYEIFSVVVKLISYKVIFVIAVANNWNIEQMNVKTAFFYGDINEEIYVKVFYGYINNRKIYCRFRKALYGLKQSSRIWFNILATYLNEQSFLALNADQSVFSNGKVIIAIYVDDLLIASSNSKLIQKAKKALHRRFQMINLGPLAYYLSIDVQRDRQQRAFYLNQKVYLKKVIRDHGMWECNPMAIFMKFNIKLTVVETDYVCFANEKHRYQSAVGSLMYAILETRSNIAYVVSVISWYASNSNKSHWKVIKRIFRYLRHSLDLRLTFIGAFQLLKGYIDVDWTDNHDTRRSTSGYVFNLRNAVISWFSKRQSTVALSTYEAEYMSQTQATKEVIWLSKLLKELHSNVTNEIPALDAPTYCLVTTIIYCNNQKAQALAKNSTSHARSKHIDIQHHFVKNKVQNNTLELRHVASNDQVADGLTKPLPKDKFLKFRRDIGLY